GRGEVQRRRRAEAAGADQQDPRLQQLQLTFLADLRDQQVTAVARALLGPERTGGDLERKAVPLPVVDTAGERDDVHVAELLQRLGREHRRSEEHTSELQSLAY